jgi:hypothetical protein
MIKQGSQVDLAINRDVLTLKTAFFERIETPFKIRQNEKFLPEQLFLKRDVASHVINICVAFL